MKAEYLGRGRGWDILAATVVVAVACAFALFATQRFIVGPQEYPEFIVGSLAWGNYTKNQDLAALPALIAALVGALWAWRAAKLRLGKVGATADTAGALVEHVLLWAIPVAIAGSAAILGRRVDPFMVLVSFAGVAALVAGAGRKAGESGEDIAFRSLALFAASVLSLLPLEIALLGGRFFEMSEGTVARAAQVSRWAFPVMLACTALATATAEGIARRSLAWVLVVAQVGMLAFYAVLLPARLIAPDGAVVPMATSMGLKFVVLAIVILGLVDVAWRIHRNHRATAGDAAAMLSPLAVFGLLLALLCGYTAIPALSSDDYHYGEALLGWWALLDFGKLPYWDYVPPRGLLADDLPGIMGRLFYDGTAASLPEARRLTQALLSLVAFLAIRWRTKSLLLASASIVLFGVYGDNTVWLLLVPFCCILLVEEMSWPRAAVWALCGIFLVIGVPSQGMVLLAATAPAVLYFAWTERSRIRFRWVLAIVAGTVVVAAIGPLPVVWYGAVRYVLENGAVNQVAWGIPWSLSWVGGSRNAGLVFELVRMSWLAAPLLAAGLIAMHYRDKAVHRWAIGVAIPAFLLFVFLSPYAMGRIDPAAQSRAGVLSVFSWAAVVPLLLLPFLDSKGRALLALVVVAACSATTLSSVSRASLDGVASPILRLPAMAVDGAGAGMPHVGRAIVGAAQWNRLQGLKQTLDELLPPREPYLDLTNRHAQHFYLGRPPMVATTAPFNMVSIGQQRREVDALRDRPPQVALVEAENFNHDGGGLALRSPLLYRFVLDTYVPELRNGFVVARRKGTETGASAAPGHAPRETPLQLREFSDVNWHRGVSRADAAVLIEDAKLASQIVPGDSLKLPGGQWRIVQRVRAEGGAIWLEGGPFGKGEFDQSRQVTINLSRSAAREHALQLWDRAFRVPDLGKIPTSWGKSWHSLERRVERKISLDDTSILPADFAAAGAGFAVVGPDPRLSLDIGPKKITGRDVGLLGFDFTCVGRRAETRLQVYWWGDEDNGPREAASVKLTAEDGMLVIPLDASPRWVALDQVRGIRIDLDTPDACSGIELRGLWLGQRASLTGSP